MTEDLICIHNDFETNSYNSRCISQEVFSDKGWFSYYVSREFTDALLELAIVL